jgi:hypothetical protein
MLNVFIVSTDVNAAGIGAGMTDGGGASVVDVTLQNGTIATRGTVGLGSSPNADLHPEPDLEIAIDIHWNLSGHRHEFLGSTPLAR